MNFIQVSVRTKKAEFDKPAFFGIIQFFFIEAP